MPSPRVSSKHNSRLRVGCWMLMAMLSAACWPPYHARAEAYISFDLNKCIDRAQAIVVGELDAEGSLLVTRIIRQAKNQPVVNAQRISLGFGHYIYRAFNHIQPAPPALEVVVFLEEKTAGEWDAFQGFAGAVRLEPAKIFIYRHGYVPATTQNGQLTYSRATFLEALFRAELLRTAQQKLLEKPRTPEQVENVIDFLLQNTRPEVPVPRFTWIYRGDEPYHSTVVKPGLHFGQIVHYFQNPKVNETEMVANRVYRKNLLQYLSLPETELLLDKLCKAQTAEQRVVLLQLMRQLALHPRYFKQLTHWTANRFAGAVRREAFYVLRDTDEFRAAEFLTRYFNWQDPDMTAVLRASCDNRSSYEHLRSLKVVEALERLVRSLPALPTDKRQYLPGSPEGELLASLARYAHPRLWNHLNTDNRETVLQQFTSRHSLKIEDVKQATWEQWWQSSREVLLREYDLGSAAGRQDWFAAYRKADVATRKVLMGLWWFEPQRDVNALLAATSGADADVAKVVLAEFWKNKHLPVSARQAIIAKFTKARLVQVKPLRPKVVELSITLDVDFPLPRLASVYSSHVITFDSQPAKVKKGSTAKIGYLRHWSEDTRWLVISDEGQKRANAALLMVEKDENGERKDLWQQPIHVDSLRLERVEAASE